MAHKANRRAVIAILLVISVLLSPRRNWCARG
jgi:hypothetical protein